jgi:serine O-acetyltransferase
MIRFEPANIWWHSCSAYRMKRRRRAKALKFLNFMLFKCLLPFEADIQKDLKLEHWAVGVVIHPNVRIGKRVRIYHQVTIATETWIGSPYRVTVGDDVVIGVGAIIVGRGNENLSIGDGAVIGAGAVVTGNVAAGQVVVGVPARPLMITRAGKSVEGKIDQPC